MKARTPSALTIANRQLAWHFDWSGGTLRTTGFENRRSGQHYPLADTHELALVYSAAVDRVARPLALDRIAAAVGHPPLRLERWPRAGNAMRRWPWG